MNLDILSNRYFPTLLISLCMVSCQDYEIRTSLKNVDYLVENRIVLYEEYENSLQGKKDSLDATNVNSEKWTLAEELFNSYRHFSLDSTFSYISKLYTYASTPRQQILSAIYEIGALIQRHDEVEAEKIFVLLDTSIVCRENLLKEYLTCGVELYVYKSIYGKPHLSDLHRTKLAEFRKSYIEIDSTSFYARKIRALMARDGGRYDEALHILDEIASEETKYHNLASVAYNKAGVYLRAGDNHKRIVSLIESVEYDFKCPVRNYLSLYELALMLYEENSLKRANKYITANLSDAIVGGFNTRMINSGKSQMIIAEASREEEKSRMIWLFTTLCCFLVMSIVLGVLLVMNRRHARRLRNVKNMLVEVNSRLKRANQDLHYANRIKDGYLFTYMELSIHYLEKIKSLRHDIRSTGKSGGLEQIMKMLRSPSEVYEEYNLYYRVFDETFLGIFPDFVSKVNGLLDESARFPVTDEKVLCTELRILAAIRLGIMESGKIATFLNCAPTTVYTYRTKLKRASICQKDEFEQNISRL